MDTQINTALDLRQIAIDWQPVSSLLQMPKNELEYDKLVALLDDLIDEVAEDEKHPLASLMDIVGMLISQYEEQHFAELN